MNSTFKKLPPARDGWSALRSDTMDLVQMFNSRRECEAWVADWNGDDSNFYVARYYLVGAMRR